MLTSVFFCAQNLAFTDAPDILDLLACLRELTAVFSCPANQVVKVRNVVEAGNMLGCLGSVSTCEVVWKIVHGTTPPLETTTPRPSVLTDSTNHCIYCCCF